MAFHPLRSETATYKIWLLHPVLLLSTPGQEFHLMKSSILCRVGRKNPFIIRFSAKITLHNQMLCFNHSNKDSFSFSENLFTEMSMFDAAFSRYLRLISGFDFAYISVVITDECPKKSRIYMRLTPLSRRCIAFECLNTCG